MTPPPVPYPKPWRARYALAALVLVDFFLATDLSLTTVLIEPMKRDMGLSDLQIGLLQGTAYGVALGLASVPLGRLIDVRPRVRLLMVGLAGWIVGMLGTGLAPDIAVLAAARVILGIAVAVSVPATFSLAADLFPLERRSAVTSMLVVGQAAGQGFGILAGGTAFQMLTDGQASGTALAPWRTLYFAAAAFGAIALAVVAGVREPARQERRHDALRTSDALRALGGYAAFLTPLIAALLFSQVTIQAAIVWATPLLIRNYGVSPGAFAGWFSAVLVAGGIAGAGLAGMLGRAEQRRGGRSGVLLPAVGAALAIAPLSLFGVMPGVGWFALLFAGDVLAGAVVATLGVIAITLYIPNELRGVALGLNALASALFAAAAAAPTVALLSGWFGGEHELGRAVAALSIPCSLAAAACFTGALRSRASPPIVAG